MYEAVQTDMQSQMMVRVAVWCIGEFGDLLLKDGVSENDIVDIVEKVLRFNGSAVQTKDYAITALMKLTTRLSPAQLNRLRGLIEEFKTNFDVELQQRAVEYSKIFPNDKVRRSLLERIPVEERPRGDAVEKETKQTTAPQPKSTASNPMSLLEELSAPVTSKAPSGSKPIDLMSELFGGVAPAATPVMSTGKTPNSTAPPKSTGAASVLDLLGDISTPTPVSQPAATNLMGGLMDAPLATTPAISSNPEFSVFNKAGLDITFRLERNAAQPNVTTATMLISNSNGSPISNFDLKAAVPTYMKMQLAPPSATVVPPMSNKSVNQQLKLLNTLHGEKPLLLKLKIDYQLNGAPVSDLANVTFPPGY